MRTPPTALRNTSWSKQRDARVTVQHREQHREPVLLQAHASRRGFGACASSTSAWISTSIGRVPSCVTMTHEPATSVAVLRQKQRRRIGHALQALLRHREHAELVHRAEAVLERADQAEARVRIALEIEHRVDHVLEHARARERAFLGHVADEDDRRCRSAWRRA